MSKRTALQVIVLFVALVAAGAPARAQTTLTSTEQDQKDLAVTVYNSNVALVRDVRKVRFPAGTIDLRFMDIAAQVNPATVHIVSLTAPKDLTVLEQNYEYDLLSPQKLLQKYVGRELTLVRMVTENNSTKEVPVKATLLAYNEGPVWKVGDQIITGMGADRYVFPDLPENLYSKPTLVWLLDNRKAGEQNVEASYLTNEVNWNADYVLTVGPDQKAADLNGWVTLVNHSGTAFRNAQLQLVAGELHRVYERVARPMAAMAMKAEVAGAAQFAQEPISEYHLYTLDRRTNIQNNESKQISLLAATGLSIQKIFQVDGQQYYYQNPQSPGAPIKDPVQVHLKFKNSEAKFRVLLLISVLQKDFGVHYNDRGERNCDCSNSKNPFIHGMIDDSNGGTAPRCPSCTSPSASRRRPRESPWPSPVPGRRAAPSCQRAVPLAARYRGVGPRPPAYRPPATRPAPPRAEPGRPQAVRRGEARRRPPSWQRRMSHRPSGRATPASRTG